MLKLLVKALILVSTISFNSLASTQNLQDVTSQWTFRGEVISAFPSATRTIELRENFIVHKVFSTKDNDGKEIRFEIFFTGDDAEYYPQFYILTNARENSNWSSSFRGKAYYIKDFSSPDRELGETPPKIDPFNLSIQQLKDYIMKEFLNDDFTIRR